MSDLHPLRELLANCSIGDLQNAIDSDIVETLISLEQRQTPTKLAEAVITCFGRRFFYEKKLRKLLLNNIPKQKLTTLIRSKFFKKDLNDALDKIDLLNRVNNFTWGNNEKSKILLLTLGLDEEEFILPKKRRESFLEPINLENKEKLESWEFSLHPYQEQIRKDIVQFLINDAGNNKLLVHMPTGSGKTRVMMEAICDFLRVQKLPTTIIWMAYSDELCTQATDTFKDRWQIRGPYPVNIVRFWGGRTTSQLNNNENNIVITSFDTAHAALTSNQNERFKFFLELRKQSSLLVVDEAHQAPAPTYSDAIDLLLGGAKLVGLTATPGSNRKEKNDVADFFDKNRISLSKEFSKPDPIRYLQDQKILSEITTYKLAGSDVVLNKKELEYVGNQLKIPDSILKILSQDVQRNIVILQEIIELVNDESQTIVFATSVKHAQLLTICLKTLGVNAACIIGGTPYNERVGFIRAFKANEINVLVNFGVLTTGFDAPKTDAVLIARPTFSVVLYSQMVGRGLRGIMMGGTENCKIVNVVDNIKNMPGVSQAFTYFENDWNLN